MIRSKYGKDMVASDKAALDDVLDAAIEEVGAVYGDVVEVACDMLLNGQHSPALKYQALHRTSWFRKYVQSYVEVRG